MVPKSKTVKRQGQTVVKLCVMPPFPREALEKFSEFDGVECVWNRPENAEIILGQPDIETVRNARSLKWVQSSSAGVDGYARHAEAFANVLLTSASGAFGPSISEWTLALVLSLYKRLPLFRDNQQNSLWRDEGAQQSPEGKNLLVLGCGDIGRRIAKVFRPFHCRAVGIRRHVSAPKPAEFDEVLPLSDLDSALPEADIVACALPSTPETKGLLNAERLSLLQRSAVLVNVGRGDLIDTDALCRLLEEGRLFGAALDVVNPEPLPETHPLWKCRNCIVTPHASGGSFGHLAATEQIIYDICRENLRRYLSGAPLKNRVDLQAGYRALEDRY